MLNKIKKYWTTRKNKITTASLFTPRQISDYFAFEGHKDINGWLSAESLSFIKYLADFQNKNVINGNIAEIGVYHGRLFIALCLMLNSGEKGLAIDVFEDQEYNLDNSGRGDLFKFTENIRNKLCTLDHIEILKSDSMKVSADQIHSILGKNSVRLFSVDGCHTPGHTLNDLRLASQVLTDNGVIILDDFKNTEWPGVEEGLSTFLKENKSYCPFAVAYNKLYITTAAYIVEYQKYVQGISSRYSDKLTYQDIAGYKVLNMSLPAPEHCFADYFFNFFDFSSTKSTLTQALLGDGWFAPEPWGVWSDGTRKAKIVLPININQKDDIEVYISFHAFVTKEFPQKMVSIFINSNLADYVTFRYGQDYYNWRYHLPHTEIMNRKELKLSFKIDNPISPNEIGLSEDKRKLGIGLRNIRLHRKS